MKSVAIIGSGFSGLSAAAFIQKNGYQATIYEKNEQIGGRARSFRAKGYTFDMGPSWYWMPDVFERFYQSFGKTTSDLYQLKRLSPSYRVIFNEDEHVDLPSNKEELYELFESIEPGSAVHLKDFLQEAQYKYEVGINQFVMMPSLSFTEFLRADILKGFFKLQLVTSIESHIRSKFKSPKLRSILEFPSLFLGATPKKTPALYSLMNYADMELGTWYPMGGMAKIGEGMNSIAEELGVSIKTNSGVEKIEVSPSKKGSIYVNGSKIEADAIISSADYHHTEQHLLNKTSQSYSEKYWDSRELAPSALIFYLGVNKKVKNLLHHNLFFDEDFNEHAKELYTTPKWPEKPLFYACVPSKTDPEVAPDGKENIFILIPLAADLKESEELKQKYLELVIKRMEKYTKDSIMEFIEYQRAFCVSDFKSEYNSFKGNAYGLANTLKQTAFLKPKIKSKRVNNLFYTGQLTVPGPGVPPAIISGEVVANYVINQFNR